MTSIGHHDLIGKIIVLINQKINGSIHKLHSIGQRLKGAECIGRVNINWRDMVVTVTDDKSLDTVIDMVIKRLSNLIHRSGGIDT